MKVFRYRLEGVLEVRRGQQDHRARELALAQSALHDAEMASVREDANLRRLLRTEGEGALPTSGTALQHRSASVLLMQRRRRACRGRVERCEATVEERRAALIESRREVRKLEIHEDRQRQTWVRDMRLEEVKQLSEAATSQHYRKRRRAGDETKGEG